MTEWLGRKTKRRREREREERKGDNVEGYGNGG